MNLIKEFQMLLTNSDLQLKVYSVKTMIYNTIYVNGGNKNNHCSHDCSHDKLLKINRTKKLCERVNDYSRAYVVNYLNSLTFLSTLLDIFVFLLLVRAYILLFTCSHLIKINIKTSSYHVNDTENSFIRYSYGSHEG